MGVMSAITAGYRRIASLDIASRAAALSFFSNTALMVLKLSVGLAFGSVALLSDGVDSAEDLCASGLAFFTVRLALQPEDEAHPYGHGKAESLAAMSQSGLIAGGAIFITVAAVRRMIMSDVQVVVGPSLIAVGITLAVNLAVAAYSLHAAKVSGSIAIASDARHLLTNVVQAATVGLGLALVWLTGSHVVDPIVALLLAAYLLWTSAAIFRAALSELIDTALPDESVNALRACLSNGSYGMRGYHRLRTRKSGREKHIDLHLLVDPALTVSAAHRMVESLEHDIRGAIPGAVVTIHLDPDEPVAVENEGEDAEPIEPDGGLQMHRH